MKYSLVDFRIFHVIQMERLQNFDKIETYIVYFYFIIFDFLSTTVNQFYFA